MNIKLYGNDGKIIFGDNKYEILYQTGNILTVKTNDGLYTVKINRCNGNEMIIYPEDIISSGGQPVPPVPPVNPFSGKTRVWIGAYDGKGEEVEITSLNALDHNDESCQLVGTWQSHDEIHGDITYNVYDTVYDCHKISYSIASYASAVYIKVIDDNGNIHNENRLAGTPGNTTLYYEF